MNAILSLSHFCETHGPTVLFSTQTFHFAGETNSGVLEPSGVRFFGCLKKLGEYNSGMTHIYDNITCEACESISGYITNDYQNKISFLSTRSAVDSNVSFLLKQAAVRSLSCEIIPGKEGQVYFGDSVRGHILSHTFFLKDSQARGFHRWYSIIVFMKDKHFLLNSWPFFQKHINKMVLQIQQKAAQVYSNEQNVCSQRGLRISGLNQKHSTARSLIKLTASSNVFAQLHLWFTWLLCKGGKRLEEHLPTKMTEKFQFEKQGELNIAKEATKNLRNEDTILHLRQLQQKFGAYNFKRFLYSILIGRQIIIRGPEDTVCQIINLIKMFLPSKKFRCQNFSDTYKLPDVYNIIGLDSYAAVPKSSETIMRVDIVSSHENVKPNIVDLKAALTYYDFLVKNESELPEKLPSLLLKIDKALSDESLCNIVVYLHITTLIGQWIHTTKIIQEARRMDKGMNFVDLMQYLGVQEQDEQLVDFWTS